MSKFKSRYPAMMIVLALLTFYACKTPSILATEEQRSGDEYANQHDYENAIVHYRNSLAQSRKLGVYRNMESEADICRKISYAFSVQGKYPQALEYAGYAFSRDSMIANQLGMIEDLREKGKVYLYMGDYKNGTLLLDQSVAKSEGLESSLKSTKLGSLADTYLTLSQVNASLGKYALASIQVSSALEIFEQLNNKTGEMECLLVLGRVSNESGNPWQAEVYVKRSEKLSRELELNTNRQLQLLADLAEDAADYSDAIRFRLEAISEAEEARILPAIIWTNMRAGDTYGAVGDQEKAESYYEKAIMLQDTAGIESAALDASAAMRTGRAKSAASYFSEIGNNISAGLAYLKLGDLMLERNNYPFAKRQYSKALKEFRTAASPEGIAIASLRLAENHFMLSDAENATRFLDSARMSTMQPETLWQIEFLDGRIAEKDGKPNEAIEAYERSIAIIEEIRGKLEIDELKSVYVNDKIVVYDHLIRLLMQEGRQNDAFDYSERARSRAFLDMIGNTRISASSEDDELAQEEQGGDLY